jgi:hypothetical protein
MKKKGIIITSVIAMLVIGITLTGVLMSRVERPNYQVITSNDSIEIRQYSPMIIAKVVVQGTRSEAINHGFRLLADYIFGNNQLNQKIAMTAPVQQQSAKIAMTAPVQQQAINPHTWIIRFIMPSQYTMHSLPTPKNTLVQLQAISDKKFIVIRFSGRHSQQNIKKHEEKLLAYIQNNLIKVSGSPTYAFYNPPWTLPFLRRNEIMLELVEQHNPDIPSR